MDRSRGGTGGLDPPGKSQVAIGSLRNTGMDPVLGSNCFSREVRMADLNRGQCVSVYCYLL